MDYSEINTMIKRLVEQLQNITPQLELARGKEAWVMQETQDSEIVEEKIEEVFVAVYKNIEMSMKIAVQLQDICPHPLVKETIDQLHNLNYSPLPMCTRDLETKKASLWKGYVEDYIDNTKDTLVAINRLSQELSEVSLSLFISQRLRNIIGEIGVLRGQFAAYEYSGIDFPNPYDIIKRKIARLLNDIKSAQEICIQVSKNAAATLIKLYHSFSDVKGLVNRNFSKGETPPQKLNSIQDDLSQFFKIIEMKYQDLLEELAVEFELDHIKFVKSVEAEQSASPKPAATEQENKAAGPPQSKYIFRKQGPNKWLVKFEEKTCILDNRVGVRYIAQLLARKKKGISAMELYQTVNLSPAKAPKSPESSEPVIDKEYLQKCNEELEELRIDLERAKKDNDLAEVSRVQQEIGQIEGVLSSGVGLRGRLRELSNDKARVRSSVTMAINRAIKPINNDFPKLYQHLKNSIHTGETCSYKPDRDIDWQL